MKQTIVLSSINHRELLRSLALNCKSSFNIKFFDSYSLAKHSLVLSGKLIDKQTITNTKQECIIYSFLKDIDYFKDSNFIDARNITRAINYARLLCKANQIDKISEVFSNGEFIEKNNALLNVFNKYIEYLDDNNLTDAIEIINYAIKYGSVIDANFVILKETPLDPLEQELLKVLSNNNYSVLSIREFANKEDKKLSNITYTNAYGGINEIEHIFAYIAKKSIAYDDCEIVLVDNTYLNHVLAISDSNNIPITIGNGLNISYFNSFKLLTLLDRFNKGYNGKNVLNDLLYADCFDLNKLWNNILANDLPSKDINSIINKIGNLRLTIEKSDRLAKYKNSITSKNEIDEYDYIERFNSELNKGYSYLIKTYTFNVLGGNEDKAINIICNYLDEYFVSVKNANLDDVIEALKDRRINYQLSMPGRIHICDLKGSLACIRKHIFICGLNARVFPGLVQEDYLLLDSDLKMFNEKNAKDSNNKIKQNKQLLFDVLDNAMAFNCNVHLSYSGYSLADLKQENPSSVLFEIFKKEKGFDVTDDDLQLALGEQVKYFDEDVSKIVNVGRKYLDGITTIADDDINDERTVVKNDGRLSPTSIDLYFLCEKRFYLTNILGIIEPEDDDPFKTFPSNDEGTLIHESMQDLGNNPNWDKKQFLDNAENKFNSYLNKRVPIHDKNIDIIKKIYLQMAEVGFDSDPHNVVYKSESYLGPYKEPITGLVVGGYVDRIEQLPNGNYLIVDYKTYKDIRNEENDIDSCFQVCLYAYLFEILENKKVERCEYRYLRNPRVIECVYNEEIKNQLIEKLSMIKQSLDTGVFNCTEDEDNCRYCKLAQICGKNNQEKIDE